MFTTVKKLSLSDSVYRQFEDRILRQELKPGDELPAERALSAQLGVNRGAVREAIKRLQQAGLVVVRHGGNSVVQDYLDKGGLELLPALLTNDKGRLNNSVVRSVMGMRSALAPDIAAGAARKPNPALAGELDAIVERMRAQKGDVKALQNHALEFWRKLVEHGNNVAFRLAFNSMAKTYTQTWIVLTGVLAAEFRDLDNLGGIATAVRSGNAELARNAGRAHVEIGRRAVEKALDAVGDRGD